MRPEIIRWGLIGLGKQGGTIAESLRHTGQAELRAVGSHDRSHARAFAEQFAIQESGTPDEVCSRDDVDAVFVASPNNMHYADAKCALENRKHVLCEKPFTLKSTEAEELIALSRTSERILGVNFHLRASPLLQKARSLIRSGVLGRVVAAEYEWYTGQLGRSALPPLPAHMRWRENIAQSGGGALMARGVHLLDLASFLFESPITSIFAAKLPLKKVVDTTLKGIFYQHELLSSFTTSRETPLPENHVRLYGSDGVLNLRDPFNTGLEGGLELRGTHATARAYPRTDLYAMAIADFQKKIAGGPDTFGATEHDALQSVLVTEALTESLKTGAMMRVL